MTNSATELTDRLSAFDAIAGHINELEDYDRFMVAVWGIKDGRLILAGRTTWQFPDADVPAALRQLREEFNQTTPLPAAKLEEA